MPTLHRLMAPLFGVALLIGATPVPAGNFYTGNGLLELCRGTGAGEAGIDPKAYNACVLYLAGVNDAEEVVVRDKDQAFCVPEQTSLEQLRRVFLLHLEQNPQYWHMPAAFLASLAFGVTWPCPD